MCFNVQSNLPEFKLVYNLRYKNKRHLQKCKFDLEFYNVNYTLIEMLGSTPSTIFQISPAPVKRFPKFRMLRDGKSMLSPFFCTNRMDYCANTAPTARQHFPLTLVEFWAQEVPDP